ncbi:hypothetical protein KVT40_002676 [Elsinoe batatas]|uniref:Uncharacterized protein n=1 Tax=Elsinoe batatas TaxID=2601811 RepID=A0A8K0L2P5_9PEZI|nr:hypothetical protein KVT40_002676 [Elsinoe batatas]
MSHLEDRIVRQIAPQLQHLCTNHINSYWKEVYVATKALCLTAAVDGGLALARIRLASHFKGSDFFNKRDILRQLHSLRQRATRANIKLEYVEDGTDDLYVHPMTESPWDFINHDEYLPDYERGWGMDEDIVWAPLIGSMNKTYPFPRYFTPEDVHLDHQSDPDSDVSDADT